ncbi:MAG: histidine kinase [Ignavibacteria bacterium RBG_13_36_8]|nr:MAG: histidine kinase [Ignavibacteria bacterium RBG_13_36_8]
MKNFRLNIIIRVIFITATIALLFYIYLNTEFTATLIILSLILIYQVFGLIKYIDATNKELSRFLHSIQYSDFSQTFTNKSLGGSFKDLNNAFNDVIVKFQNTRSEKEEHYRYLQTVMQHVGVGLISFDQNGKVEFINNAAKKILRVQHLANLEGLNKISVELKDKLLILKSGERATIKITDDNELLQLVINATEFKLRNQLYKLVSLQNIQSELEEKEMEAWQKLIRVLTHEIMNSVTPISSLSATVNNILSDCFSSTSKPDEDSIKDISNAVNSIHKRSEGLIHFVDNYRNLTKIPKPNFQIFPVKNLFERIEKLMQHDLRTKKIKFSSSIDPVSLELTADPEMIEQVLINLIINAMNALETINQPEIYLVSFIDQRGKVVIRVIDNGPGIPEEVLEKIFIPFFSTKKDGSGIGLSISRQILRAHGGSIRVNSIPNKETVFTLRF